MNEDIKRFKIYVPEATFEDLRDRLARTRWPDEVNDEETSEGSRWHPSKGPIINKSHSRQTGRLGYNVKTVLENRQFSIQTIIFG